MSDLAFTPEYLYKIQQLNVKLRRNALGTQSGIHRSMRKGHGLEFSDLRPYSPGDDFRAVDWNALARTDKLYTRLYREEQDTKVLVVHDHSKSLAPFSLAKKISLSICYIGLCSGDSVSLLLPNIEQFPWVRSPKVFKKMLEFVDNARPSKEVQLGRELIKATSSLKIPARVYVVSDFLYPLEQIQQALEYGTNKNFDMSLVVIDNMDLSNVTQDSVLLDSESGEELSVEIDNSKLYLEVQSHFRQISELAKHYNQQMIIARHDEEIEDVMFTKCIESGFFK